MNTLKSACLRMVFAALLSGAATLSSAQSTVHLDSEPSQISYSIGVNIGQNLVSQGLMEDIDVDIFMAGLRDSVNGNTRLSDEQMMTALMAFQQQMMDQQTAAMESAREESEAFLTQNAMRNEVTTTASGLQYEVLSSAAGDAVSPTPSDTVLAHYHGSFVDGSVFDSSVERGQPAEFGVSQVKLLFHHAFKWIALPVPFHEIPPEHP